MTQAPSCRVTLGFAFRALRHRTYRLFFAHHAVSLFGRWTTRIAMGWLVYRLTGSAFMLGLVSFVGLVAILVLMPLGGVVADRWSRHRVLQVIYAIDTKNEALYVGQQMDVFIDVASLATSAPQSELGERQP
jgi:MFS family permease